MRAHHLSFLALLLAACATPRPGVRRANPVDVVTAGAMAASEVAGSKPEEHVLAWDLHVIGERASYRTCTAEDACTMRLVEVDAKKVLGVKLVSRARPVGENGAPLDEVDVVQLRLTKDVELSRGGAASDPTRGVVVGGKTK